MPEYKDKKGNEKMQAFNDRTKRTDFPYILDYEQSIEPSENLNCMTENPTIGAHGPKYLPAAIKSARS